MKLKPGLAPGFCLCGLYERDGRARARRHCTPSWPAGLSTSSCPALCSLVPGIHVLYAARVEQNVDGRDKPSHEELCPLHHTRRAPPSRRYAPSLPTRGRDEEVALPPDLSQRQIVV